jgi:hypothetical protein
MTIRLTCSRIAGQHFVLVARAALGGNAFKIMFLVLADLGIRNALAADMNSTVVARSD